MVSRNNKKRAQKHRPRAGTVAPAVTVSVALPSPLFSGDGFPLGGLSNERDLARLCPPQFQRKNPWQEKANDLFFHGGDTSDWPWKPYTKDQRAKVLSCLRGMLGTFSVSHDDKVSVIAWMLSEALTEVPR